MRRRVKTEDTNGIPRELVSYLAWCECRGLQPYSHPLAVQQCEVWLDERRDYAQAHCIEDLDYAEEQLPIDFWDPNDCLPHSGVWSRIGTTGPVRCERHGLTAADQH